MSQSNAKEITLMRIEIGMDSKTKTAFEEFKAKCNQALDKLSEIASKTKQADGGLLRAMQAEAANDSAADEQTNHCEAKLKQMGQWVFAGQDDKWQSAGVDCHGRGYLFDCKKETLLTPMGTWVIYPTQRWRFIGNDFDSSNWQQSLINRETINDVDYLTEDKRELGSTEASEIVVDELQSKWLAESVPRITETDLQLIFIKNLSTTLIQRMHSMDRFSEDDYHIGGDKLMLWDIITRDSDAKFGIITGGDKNNSSFVITFLNVMEWDSHITTTSSCPTKLLTDSRIRSITQDELNDFRQALEVCYAKSK